MINTFVDDQLKIDRAKFLLVEAATILRYSAQSELVSEAYTEIDSTLEALKSLQRKHWTK